MINSVMGSPSLAQSARRFSVVRSTQQFSGLTKPVQQHVNRRNPSWTTGLMALAMWVAGVGLPHRQISAMEPVKPSTGPMAAQADVEKAVPAKAVLAQIKSLKPTKRMTSERAYSFIPLIEKLSKAVQGEKDLAVLQEAKIQCLHNLLILPDNRDAQFPEKGLPFILAVLDLEDALLTEVKGRNSEEDIKDLQKDLVWYLEEYRSEPEVLKKATNVYIKHFLSTGDLPSYIRGIDFLKPSFRNDRSRLYMVGQTWDRVEELVKANIAQVEGGKDSVKVLTSLQALHQLQAQFQDVLSTFGDKAEPDYVSLRQKVQAFFNPALAQLVKQQLVQTNTIQERIALGHILGAGVISEGVEQADKAMRRLGLFPGDVLSYGPPMSKPDRYGKVGPFTQLLLDCDRVAVCGDEQIYRGFVPFQDQNNLDKRMDFQHHAVTAYLSAALEMSKLEEAQYLVGLMMTRFELAMKQDFYRLAHRPDPGVWGEHMGVYLSVSGGREVETTSGEQHFQRKAELLRKVLVTGHQEPSPLRALKTRQDGLFDLYRWNRQYWLLLDKGITHPFKETDRAQKAIDDPAFQKQLDDQVEQGWRRFKEALSKTPLSPGEQSLLHHALGRKPE